MTNKRFDQTPPEQVVIETKPLLKTLKRVALPIALQSLIASSLNLIDTLMVGSLGEVELASVGLSTQLFFIHWGVLFGFSSGASAFMSQFFGVRDLASIRKVLGFAVTFCFGIGMVFFLAATFFPEYVLRLFTDIPEAIELGSRFLQRFAFCFLTVSITVPCTAALRSTQQTQIPLYISMFVFTVNTSMAYLLIFGKFGLPAMGTMGAATALVTSRSLELILVLYVIFGKKNILAGPLDEFFAWRKILVVRILGSALPVTVNETMWSLGMATYNAFYGRMGITEYAAIQASNTINQLFILAIFSLGDALLILVGQRIGMGQMDYAYALAKRLIRIGIIVGLISGGLLIISSRFIVILFNFTDEGRYYMLWILAIYGCMMWLKVYGGLQIVGTLRCGGDTKFAMLVEVGCVWGIGVPLVFFGVFLTELPVYLIVMMAQAEEIGKSLICRRRFYSRKWLNNLIEGI
ncbi:MATE family efflux transporter [Bacillota bacterium]